MPYTQPIPGGGYDPVSDQSIPPQSRIQIVWGRIQAFHGIWARQTVTAIAGAITGAQNVRR